MYHTVSQFTAGLLAFCITSAIRSMFHVVANGLHSTLEMPEGLSAAFVFSSVRMFPPSFKFSTNLL